MDKFSIAIIFFFYGLAFYSMGLAILLEIGHGSDERLRRALRPLSAFGFIHGSHEWLEMFSHLHPVGLQPDHLLLFEGGRLALLSFSFLSLGAFGAFLLSKDEYAQRLSLLFPLGLSAIWGVGLFIIRGHYTFLEMMDITDVWTRYSLALPSALVASAGLINQQRRFRRAGMAQFGRDSLWAAVAFFWYGIIGQTFTRPSALPPSTIVNQNLFLEIFGFPVQILRAGAAITAATFVMRFLRSFEVEMRNQIIALQAARLEEAERREALRGELLRRVVEAQEAERQRIARELHDATGQALTAIGLGLRGASTTLRQDLEKATLQLRQLESLVARSLDELQRIIADLRPSHLDDLGLPAALRWYAAEVQNRTPLQVTVEVSGEVKPLSSETKIALFRIAQEALTNTIKHARAKHAHIALVFGNEDVTLQVNDDGCGFDTNHPDRKGRHPWGLEGMKERASLLGGQCHILSSPGRGTLVVVTIPYQFSEEER